jgi:hypothetical protein
MEFFSQYDALILYLTGDRNCAADTSSCLPDSATTTVASIISGPDGKQIKTCLELEDAFLDNIKQVYRSDPFTTKLHTASAGMDNIRQTNGLWQWLWLLRVRLKEDITLLVKDEASQFTRSSPDTSLSLFLLAQGLKLEKSGSSSGPSCPSSNPRSSLLSP